MRDNTPVFALHSFVAPAILLRLMPVSTLSSYLGSGLNPAST